MNVFILFCVIYTSQGFILPPKMHRTQRTIKLYDNNKKREKNENLINLLNKNTNLTNIMYNNFISSINENVNNCLIYLLKKEYDIDAEYEREILFNKKFIEPIEDSFNKNTNYFFKQDSNYNSNYTNLIFKHIHAVNSLNDKVINTINSINVSSFNENLKWMKKTMSIPTKQEMVRTINKSNDFLYKKLDDFVYKTVKNNNNNNPFINLHYMLFKNQILESLTSTEHTKHSDDCDCLECHCYECHVKGCYDNESYMKDCEDCHKECSVCCHCDDCDDDCIIEYDENDILVNKEKDRSCNHNHIHSKECSKSDYDDITDNNFIDTIGLVPVGIFPNFIIRFLLKNLLIPF